MSVTQSNNVIRPEVMAPMINAKVDAALKLLKYAKLDTSLVGVPGDTVTVPSWNYVGDAEDLPEGAEAETAQLTATTSTFTVKNAIKSIAVSEKARISGHGNPVGQAEKQLSMAIVGKVQSDVLDAAYTANNTYAPSTLAVIGYNGIVDAVTKFGDENDDIDKVMFIHPAQEATMLKDANFLSADKFTAGVAVRGAIGKVAGCWIKKSKKVKLIAYEKAAGGSITIVADSAAEDSTNKHLATIQPGCAAVLKVGDKVNSVAAANQYYLNPIIKLEADDPDTEATEDELAALTIFLKQDTKVDHEWFPKKQQHDLTAYRYYGVALTNAEKVILAKFKK